VSAIAGEITSARGLRLKRVIDVCASFLLLVLASPLMLALAIGVKLDSAGPVIFRQRRVGIDGREFTMLKLRSMCEDAEERLAGLAHLNAGGSRLIRIPSDPRVTRLGAFLRRSSLAELPQLVNVLRGEMSLVGPRPQSPSEVALYTSHQRRRLGVRPGMTGLWQVTSRDDPAFDEWVRLDLDYIQHWSLGLDMRILARTPSVVLGTANRRTGDLP
jgi:lipopolysaccharide/colanic/teichoic acid biosynthesis glycosyltransferase